MINSPYLHVKDDDDERINHGIVQLVDERWMINVWVCRAVCMCACALEIRLTRSHFSRNCSFSTSNNGNVNAAKQLIWFIFNLGRHLIRTRFPAYLNRRSVFSVDAKIFVNIFLRWQMYRLHSIISTSHRISAPRTHSMPIVIFLSIVGWPIKEINCVVWMIRAKGINGENNR